MLAVGHFLFLPYILTRYKISMVALTKPCVLDDYLGLVDGHKKLFSFHQLSPTVKTTQVKT